MPAAKTSLSWCRSQFSTFSLTPSLPLTIYKQTYDTPMGSPLSPIADIVMQDLETESSRKKKLAYN